MVNTKNKIYFGIGLIVFALVGNALAYPQSSRFDEKQAILTDSKGQAGVATLDSRFDTGDLRPPQNSIGYYPYGSGKVPYLIPNQYPQVQTFYGFNSKPIGQQTNIGGPFAVSDFQNGGFGGYRQTGYH